MPSSAENESPEAMAPGLSAGVLVCPTLLPAGLGSALEVRAAGLARAAVICAGCRGEDLVIVTREPRGDSVVGGSHLRIVEVCVQTGLGEDLLVPVVHGVTYDELREESPLLASRSGLDTAEDTMETIAIKVSELVAIDAY